MIYFISVGILSEKQNLTEFPAERISLGIWLQRYSKGLKNKKKKWRGAEVERVKQGLVT